MLDSGARGFVAIDPWGAVGERAFDVATWAAEHPPTLIAERASALAGSLRAGGRPRSRLDPRTRSARCRPVHGIRSGARVGPARVCRNSLAPVTVPPPRPSDCGRRQATIRASCSGYVGPSARPRSFPSDSETRQERPAAGNFTSESAASAPKEQTRAVRVADFSVRAVKDASWVRHHVVRLRSLLALGAGRSSPIASGARRATRG
jgi:hypothetical protein